jgi:hypothetical protein
MSTTRQYYYIFLKTFTWEKIQKKFQAQKLKMADESPIFSDYNFKNDKSSKKKFLLTKNTTYVEQFFFSKNSKWRINQNGDFFNQFFEML